MILFGILMLVAIIWFIWKLLIDGLLFKLILFCAGWVGLYIICRVYMESGKNTAFTVGTGHDAHTFSVAWVVATVVFVLALICTRVRDD